MDFTLHCYKGLSMVVLFLVFATTSNGQLPSSPHDFNILSNLNTLLSANLDCIFTLHHPLQIACDPTDSYLTSMCVVLC